MRILRGQSNLEVSSTGFALFVVGLVIATFFGGVLRVALQSDQVHQRIVSQLKERLPKQEIEIGRTEVLLSQGMWPALGLKVHNLVVKQDVCGKLSFVLTLPEAVLPLDLLSLRKGVWRLGDVEISGGELHLDYRDCAAPVAEGHPRARHEPPASAQPENEHSTLRALHFDWRTLAKYMDGVDLNGFVVTYEKNPTWKLVFTRGYMGLGRELTASAQVDVEKSLPFGATSHTVDFDLHGDQNLMQWKVTSEFKEGRVYLTGSLDPKSEAGLVKLNLKQVPLKDVLFELHQIGWLEQDLRLQAAWLTCGMKWEGQLPKYSEMPVVVSNCRIEGAYGRAELAQADVWMEGSDYFKIPAHIQVSALQVQPLLEAMNKEVLPAVFSRLGEWSGEVNFTNAEQWSFDGHLKGPEIVFSSQSVHGKQIVDDVRVQASQKGDLARGRLDEIQLREGDFAGAFDFELKNRWHSGTFQAAVQRFRLNPAIQKILVGGTIGEMSGKGDGRLENGELVDFSGAINVKAVRGEGWSTESVQSSAQFGRGLMSIEVRARSAIVNPQWKYYSKLLELKPELKNELSWNDLSAKLKVQKQGGTLQAFSATELPAKRRWKGGGSWVRDGEFDAWLNPGETSRAKPFALRGENGDLNVMEEPGARIER